MKVTDSLAEAAIEPEKLESSSTLNELRPKEIKNGTDGALPPPPPPPHEARKTVTIITWIIRITNYI